MDALVLSAGGMFGAWQAGAWRVLARRFQPAVIVGNSVGALNGWAIAGGIDPDRLVADYWRNPRLAALMQPRVPFPPWQGIFAPQALEALALEFFETFRPRVPFATTMVEVPRLEAVLVRGEEMTWRHLLASCSIPLGFPPVRIGTRYYVDGGLLGVLPLWASAKLGATRALALDAMPRVPSRVIRQAALSVQRVAGRVPRAVPASVARLTPSALLGGLRAAITWDAGTVERWIELGTRDAENLLSRTADAGTVFD